MEGEEPEQGDDEVDDLNEPIEILLTCEEPAETSTALYSSTFHTTFGGVTQQEGRNMAKLLADQTVQHTYAIHRMSIATLKLPILPCSNLIKATQAILSSPAVQRRLPHRYRSRDQ